MKKILSLLIALPLIAILVYCGFVWVRIEKLRVDTVNAFDSLAGFYLAMDENQVQKLGTPPDLDSVSSVPLSQFRQSIVMLKEKAVLAERVEMLRGAQRAAYVVFATATGSILGSGEYEVWRRESSSQGKVYPLILAYNQAAQAFADGLQGFVPSLIARLRHLEAPVLIEANGDLYQQQPITI